MAAISVLAVLAVIGIALIVYIIMIYNGLIRLKHNVDQAWSNIDVLLKQRYDELPKLLNVCKGYMKHERETLEAVIKARRMAESAGTSREMLQANNAITDTLQRLFAVVEQYPELKADAVFLRMSSRISELEDQIADRRELFNASINIYNIRIEQFPDVIIAGFFRFQARTLWEIDPAHRGDVVISFE